MNIPRYWAEHRIQEKRDGRQVTVRRWGWSDQSDDAARALAEIRCKEAMARVWSGEKLSRREKAETYGNGDGMPIREELVKAFPHAAITRNRYGALCLNTPRVLFADVDGSYRDPLRVPPWGCAGLMLAGVLLGVLMKSLWLGALVGIGLPFLWFKVNEAVRKRRHPRLLEQAKAEGLASIRAFSEANPDWHIRIYETVAGYRLLAMHGVFDPRDEATGSMLHAMNSDPRFVRLCALQNCFRARISPKYWRMGYRPAESLPKSKWPFPDKDLPRREKWIEGYDRLSPGFASCRFVERLGSPQVHPEAEEIRRIHDEYCRSDSSLPLA
ncbi:MAG: hypothetical protein MUF31_12145 [Akkermansiaceae bacterium]|nr:hypothetical protein [Akkermansiaceae bacterium]